MIILLNSDFFQNWFQVLFSCENDEKEVKRLNFHKLMEKVGKKMHFNFQGYSQMTSHDDMWFLL